MPNTPIVGDPRYHINRTTLAIQHGDGWQTLTKCTTNTNPVLDYPTMPSQPPSTKEQGRPYAVIQPNGGTPESDCGELHKCEFIRTPICQRRRATLVELSWRLQRRKI
jgi:hypothetical protein